MPTLQERLREASVRGPVDIEEADLTSSQFIICDTLGFFTVPYAGHASVYGRLLAYREGYSSLEDLVKDKPYMFTRHPLDVEHAAMDIYLKEYGGCYRTQCSERIIAWSDTSVSLRTHFKVREAGYNFLYVGEKR